MLFSKLINDTQDRNQQMRNISNDLERYCIYNQKLT